MEDKGSILIVDDDVGISRTLALILEKNGYETETCRTGQDAIAKALRSFFNVAIVDIKLPDVEGLELLALLKEIHPQLGVILITGFASVETALRALNEGASAYIIKPLNMDEVLATVREALEKQSLMVGKNRVEEELRRSEERLRALYKGIPVPTYTWQRANDDFLLVDYNNAAEAITQGRVAALVGKKASEVFHDMPELFEDFSRAFAEKATVTRDGLYQFESVGESRYFIISCAFVPTDLLLVHMTDVTTSKEMEEALRESEEKYRNVVERANDGIAIIQDTVVRYVNQRSTEILGYTAEEIVDIPIVSFIHPEELPNVMERYEQRMTGKHVEPIYETALRHKDGSRVEVEMNAGTISYLGKIADLIIVRDITERKKAEQQLRESAEVYRTLVETASNAGEAIFIFQDIDDREGVIVFANKEALRLTGYPEAELLDKTLEDILHQESVPLAMDYYRRRREGEVPRRFEAWLNQKGGALRPIEVSAGVATYQGRPASIAYVRDISERKRMEESLMTSERMASVGQLASGVAHELNNPLTGVIGFSQLLLEKDIPQDIREDIEIVYREAQRASAVVRNLLTFARKHAPVKEPVDINGVIQKVLELRGYEERVSNIQVDTRFAPDLPHILADFFQLQQVFLNIVINAEHSMIEAHNEGTLTVTTEEVGDAVRASFADDGLGIPKENLGYLFEPFFTTKEVGKGTGLGLSICHGIVTEHGGRIYAESEVGQGATFIVELPVNSAGAKEAS